MDTLNLAFASMHSEAYVSSKHQRPKAGIPHPPGRRYPVCSIYNHLVNSLIRNLVVLVLLGHL